MHDINVCNCKVDEQMDGHVIKLDVDVCGNFSTLLKQPKTIDPSFELSFDLKISDSESIDTHH